MREIKRRTDMVNLFPNEPSCDRLVGAQLLERHKSWQCEPARYLCMEHLFIEQLGEQGPARPQEGRGR